MLNVNTILFFVSCVLPEVFPALVGQLLLPHLELFQSLKYNQNKWISKYFWLYFYLRFAIITISATNCISEES
jgi:hypothetical protein